MSKKHRRLLCLCMYVIKYNISSVQFDISSTYIPLSSSVYMNGGSLSKHEIKIVRKRRRKKRSDANAGTHNVKVAILQSRHDIAHSLNRLRCFEEV